MTEKKTVFMVDSGCEPTRAFKQKYDLEFVGINVVLDGRTYVDGEQLLQEQFYARVDGVKDFATTPPTASDMIKKYKAFGSDNNKPYMDQAFQRLIAKLPMISIKNYQVISGRGWPTETCHSGPDVFALSVYGERNPI